VGLAAFSFQGVGGRLRQTMMWLWKWLEHSLQIISAMINAKR